MYRIVAIPALTLALLPLIGCGSAPTPTAVPQPLAPAPVKPVETVGRPRQVPKQVTVMGKNGPETITVMETVTDSTQKMAVMPAEPIKPLPKTRILPGGASPPQGGEKAPRPRAKQ
jgi:hypothetical protein